MIGEVVCAADRDAVDPGQAVAKPGEKGQLRAGQILGHTRSQLENPTSHVVRLAEPAYGKPAQVLWLTGKKRSLRRAAFRRPLVHDVLAATYDKRVAGHCARSIAREEYGRPGHL